ncbi:putative transcriptional regulatory [Hyphodiscus hymeniophilus]|uniref:Transcriptional regulatory n=1 Tax=Hyphodiscus hymeniophilus TaxID=353542 RepID=A0A9P7AZB9_9HELO|nr:putative transcriptional regulatory [Hyphodiscus hymeniophilus]
MDSQNRGKKTGKARIPDHLRRRALVSCDRCKKRRIRCMRSAGADPNEPCQSCLEVGVSCESTLPRKTRIYGSVETLSLRYRVLDALIKGLYPYKDTNNIDTLYAIAEAHDITLPTFNDQTVAEEVFNQQPIKNETPPPQSVQSVRSPSNASKESDFHPSSESSGQVVQEKLVPLLHGPSHYIGPSSSFGFVLSVRNMVAEFNNALKNIQPDDERSKLSSDFAGSNWSKALEPIVKDESDESSEDHVSVTSESAPSVRTGVRAFLRPPLFGGPTGGSAPTSRSRKATIVSFLPSRDVTDTFMNAYFEQVHPNYLLFHRKTFQSRYELMFAQPPVLMRDVEPGWICCIFMILVFGAQALEDRDKKQSVQIQRYYLDLVQNRLHQLISTTTLVNVQAILLLQLYQHNCTERNSAFMLLGCASRMAMALGMHREGTSGGFDEMEREVRKRVWWTAYTFEQNQCAILGRPCAIDDTEVNLLFPDETLLDGGDSVPPGYIEYSVRLTKLMSDVRRKIYASPHGPGQGDYPKASIAIQFLLDLDSWMHSLPQPLRLECLSLQPKHRRAVILLHIQFHHTQALVSRPYVLHKVSVQLARKLGQHVRSQDLDKEEMNLSHACGIYSKKTTVLLHQLIADGIFDGVSWLDAYYIYHSVFILSLDFLARPWDDQETPEDASRKKAVRDVMDALQDIKLCPTFTILTQVSLQLAKIVGIFDTRNPQSHDQRPEDYRLFMTQQQQAAAISYEYGAQASQPGVENVVNSWFQKEAVDMPWDLKDFFGVDGYVGPSNTNYTDMPMGLEGPYSGHLPGVGDEDGLNPAPPMGYTHWGSIDTPFAQSNRTGSSSGGSNFKPGNPMGRHRIRIANPEIPDPIECSDGYFEFPDELTTSHLDLPDLDHLASA